MADDTRSSGVAGMPGIPGVADMPGVFHFAHFRRVLQYLVTRMTLRCNVFVDIFVPLSAKTYTFESISGKQLSRNALKGVEQVNRNTHCNGASSESPSTVKHT